MSLRMDHQRFWGWRNKDWRGRPGLYHFEDWEVNFREWDLECINRDFKHLESQQNGQNRWGLGILYKCKVFVSMHKLLFFPAQNFLQSASSSCRIFIPFLSLLDPSFPHLSEVCGLQHIQPCRSSCPSSAFLGKISITVGRGWIHRWEEVVEKNWLEGRARIWQSFCHENKGRNCFWFPIKQK